MSDALADKLRLKYGLTRQPSNAQIADWHRWVEAAIAEGEDEEQAGRRAASQTFGELDAILFFSEADTIEALLASARGDLAIGLTWLQPANAEQGEAEMRDLGVALRIKYRLREVPSEADAARWAEVTERRIQEGSDPEEAGLHAARQLFEIVPNLILKAEADTIAALLAQARKK